MEASSFYLIFGILWIYFSDQILGTVVQDQQVYERIQTYKGMFYVVFTAFLLYLVIRYDATKIYKQAYYDQLTGLKNRITFDNDVARLIRKKQTFSVYVIDINNFKHLNEIHGHEYGDQLLQGYGDQLAMLEYFEAYRWWGDQFLLILKGNHLDSELLDFVNKIKLMSNTRWSFGDFDFNVSVSIGVISYPKDGTTTKMLNQNIDVCINKAKELGKDSHVLYSKVLSEEVEYYTRMEDELRKALSNDMFELYCQPIYNLSTKEIKSYEVLLRWFHKDSIFHNIGHVIEAAERTEQIGEIDRWVVASLFKQIQSNRELGQYTFNINLSSTSFNSKAFVGYLIEQTTIYGIDPKQIVLEITEHSIVDDFDRTIDTMLRIKDIGFRIALDDFGTMYSSLSYLSKLPLDILKIDKTYVDGVLGEGKDIEIVKLIIQLGYALKMEVVGEGIEEQAQNDQLAKIGCVHGQGYYFARPMPILDIIKD